MKVIRVSVFDLKDFRRWLEKNHDKENKVELLIHKKHTQKPSPSHLELMHEAICFGWIDTVVKSIDSDTYIRTFQRRSKNSRWSLNTLKYGKQLIKENRMAPAGLKFYKEGLKKLPHDHGIPSNPEAPEELVKELNKKKNKKAREKFEKLSPSQKRIHLRWLFRAKRQETRMKRINHIIENLSKTSN